MYFFIILGIFSEKMYVFRKRSFPGSISVRVYAYVFACEQQVVRGQMVNAQIFFSLFLYFSHKYAKLIFCIDANSHALPACNLAAIRRRTQCRVVLYTFVYRNGS